MASTPSGHHPDKPHKTPKIDEQLWAECQAMIPKAWIAAAQQARQLMEAAGFPKQFPSYLGKFSNGVKVFLIDGDKTMVSHDMDFVSGANGLEDPDLLGKMEIALDDEVALSMPQDYAYILMHEETERRAMAAGMSYERAHDTVANPIEKALRQRNQPRDGSQDPSHAQSQ